MKILIFKYEHEMKTLKYRMKNQNLREHELIVLSAEFMTLQEVVNDLKKELKNGTN